MNKPTWGNQISAHAKQGQIALDSITLMALAAIELIFAFKKIWFALGGYYLQDAVNWTWVANFVS